MKIGRKDLKTSLIRDLKSTSSVRTMAMIKIKSIGLKSRKDGIY